MLRYGARIALLTLALTLHPIYAVRRSTHVAFSDRLTKKVSMNAESKIVNFSTTQFSSKNNLSSSDPTDEEQAAVTMARQVAAHDPNAGGEGTDPGWLFLSSKMCWDAVYDVLRATKVINAETYQRIYGKTEGVIRTTNQDARVKTAEEAIALEAGMILGFYAMPNAQLEMVHLMLTLGNGMVAGQKNNCVQAGVCDPVAAHPTWGHLLGWEILDLRELKWVVEGPFRGIRTQPKCERKVWVFAEPARVLNGRFRPVVRARPEPVLSVSPPVSIEMAKRR